MRLIAIGVDGLDGEVVSDRCWQAGAAGIWERDGELRVGVEDADLAAFLRALSDLSPRDVTEVEAVELAGRLASVPTGWGDVELWVPPTVFGDGLHPTTATCIELIERHVRPGDRLLDVGCGAGALAVVAARAGAVVRAIDVDPDAVSATADNAVRNDVAVSVDATPLGEVAGPFDVVVANLTVGGLGPLVADLVGCTAPGGLVIVSGLLVHQWPPIRDGLGGTTIEQRTVEGWVSAALRLA